MKFIRCYIGVGYYGNGMMQNLVESQGDEVLIKLNNLMEKK